MRFSEVQCFPAKSQRSSRTAVKFQQKTTGQLGWREVLLLTVSCTITQTNLNKKFVLWPILQPLSTPPWDWDDYSDYRFRSTTSGGGAVRCGWAQAKCKPAVSKCLVPSCFWITKPTPLEQLFPSSLSPPPSISGSSPWFGTQCYQISATMSQPQLPLCSLQPYLSVNLPCGGNIGQFTPALESWALKPSGAFWRCNLELRMWWLLTP